MSGFDLEDRRAEIERHRENAPRLAEAVARFDSNGQGSVEFPTRVDFGLIFYEKPYVQYCSEIDLDELGDMLDTDVHDNKCPPMPLTAGYVTDWDTDDQGFFVGAFCGARVYFPTTDLVDITLDVPVTHHFRFSGIGMKNVPTDLG